MEELIVRAGILAAGGWVICKIVAGLAAVLKKAPRSRTASEAPTARPSAQPQTPSRAAQTTPPLPRRRNAAIASPRAAGNTGPRGLRPSQFPCCPICRQRNNDAVQKIYWDRGKNRYYCTRNHQFAQNGKIIVS